MTIGEEELAFPPRVVDALSEHLRNQPQEARVKQEIAGAYYDDELTFDQLRSLVGDDEAENFRVLKEQLNGNSVAESSE